MAAMSQPMPMVRPETNPDENVPVRSVWQEAVGKVFKLVSKPYGIRNVTYVQVKSVRPVGFAGDFEVEVLCVEIIARVLDGKRTHSNICKEGVMHHLADSALLPASFGVECPLPEFEKVTGAILAYTNTYLEWVMQEAPEEQTEVGIPADLPHLSLTDMEASLVRNSPFLAKDLYFVSRNSIRAAVVSMRQELQRASRSMLLVDAVDPVYIARKNEATASLRAKLSSAQREVTAKRKDTNRKLLQLDSLCLALLGQPSTTTVKWLKANPSEEGPVYCIGLVCSALEFVRWAHASGRQVPAEMAARKELRAFFNGWNGAYTGPDRDGVYPLMKPATD